MWKVKLVKRIGLQGIVAQVTFCMAAALGMKDLSRDTQLFENFDTDKSGQLDTDELKAGLARLGLRQETAVSVLFPRIMFSACFVHLNLVDLEDPSGLMAAMDLDQESRIGAGETFAALASQCKDGQISYTEFLAATLCLDEVLQGVFDRKITEQAARPVLSLQERGERLMRYALPDSLSLMPP